MGPIHPVWARGMALFTQFGKICRATKVLVFVSQKTFADELCSKLEAKGHSQVQAMHGGQRDSFLRHSLQQVGIPISPTREESSIGPHWVNRAHWPTKENDSSVKPQTDL